MTHATTFLLAAVAAGASFAAAGIPPADQKLAERSTLRRRAGRRRIGRPRHGEERHVTVKALQLTKLLPLLTITRTARVPLFEKPTAPRALPGFCVPR